AAFTKSSVSTISTNGCATAPARAGCAASPSGTSRIRRLSSRRSPDRPPYPLRGGGHIDVLDAERGERVEHGGDDGLRRGDGAGLARPLNPERVGRGRQA